MENQTQLALIPYEDLRTMAVDVHKSQMLGTSSPEQALALMGICQADGIHPSKVFQRYHIIENKPSLRADYQTGEFMVRKGTIIWHIRTDEICAATFFSNGITVDEEAICRGRARCRAIIKNDLEAMIDLSMPGEATIVRTYKDCEKKGLTEGRNGTKTNWFRSPRQMLTARVETEGIGLIDPGLKAGTVTEDEAIAIAEDQRRDQLPEPTQDQRIMAQEAKRLEDNGLDPAGAQPFKPEPATRQEKPVAGNVVEMPPQEPKPRGSRVPTSEPMPEELKPAPKAESKGHPEEAKPAQPPVAQALENDNKEVASAPAIAQAAPSTDGRPPITTMTVEELPSGEKWRAHIIECIAHPEFKGRRLDALSLEQLEQIHRGWVVKLAEKIAQSEKKKVEAALITYALDYRKNQAKDPEADTDAQVEERIYEALM